VAKQVEPAKAKSDAGDTGHRNEFAAVDALALGAPPEAESSLPALAKYLARGSKTEREKARAVYRWVTDRIAYDADSFFSGRTPDPSPEATLRQRCAVCAGYAALFTDLCRRLGLQAAVVTGYVKGISVEPGAWVTSPNHAWNAVRLGGKWCLVDATWGAGSIDGRRFRKEFTDFYFLTPPEQLTFTHLPEDAKWQTRKPALTLDEFNRRPKIGPALFQMGLSAEAVERQIAAPDFRGVVKSFKMPFPVTALTGVPVGRHLRAGADYQFEFRADRAAGFAAIVNGRVTPFSKDDGVFRATVRPAPGEMLLGVEVPGSSQSYAVLLEYTAE
jgi:hypothetical protein